MKTILEKIEYEKRLRLSIDASTSFRSFVYASWPEVERATTMVQGWHIDAIAEHLQALHEGQIKKLAISVPPRHMKSTMVSVMFPAWVWTKSPGTRFLTASYRSELAIRDALRSRELMQTEWYKSFFGKIFQFNTKQDTKSHYNNNFGGYRMCTSVKGGATGEGGSFVGVDDPHNIIDATSDTERERVLRWWDTIMSSRLNDQTSGRMFIIGQRIHQNDLIGHVLNTNQGFEYLRLPAEYESSKKTYTCIGWEDPRKIEGEPLWPIKFPVEVLQNLRRVLQGAYYAQYQQSPVKDGGNILKQNTFQRYHREGDVLHLFAENGMVQMHLQNCRIFITSDLAISKKQGSDFTVFAIWALTRRFDCILLDLHRAHYDGPEAEAKCKQLADQYRPKLSGIVIEDIAYQKDFLQRIQYAGYPVIPFRPASDKVSRAHDIAVYFNNGQFFFPDNAPPWLAQYEKELTDFPTGEKDDVVDATSILTAVLGSAKPRIRDFTDGPLIVDKEWVKGQLDESLRRLAPGESLGDLPEIPDDYDDDGIVSASISGII